MTKAEKIFKDTYYSCKQYVKSWGVDEAAKSGFARLSTEELTSTRTWNEIQRYIDREKRDIKLDLDLNILTVNEATILEAAINMVQATLDNTRNRI